MVILLRYQLYVIIIIINNFSDCQDYVGSVNFKANIFNVFQVMVSLEFFVVHRDFHE